MSLLQDDSSYEKNKIEITSQQIWIRRLTTLAPLWTLLVMFLFFSIVSDSFLSRANMNNLLVQISTMGILATGMTFVLLTAQIDLSIAAIGRREYQSYHHHRHDICGFTTALAGLVNTGRLGTALTNPENSFLIDAIAVVVLGGTSLMGGRGGIAQTVVGLLIYGTFRNGLDNIPTIDPLTKDFITGIVLMFALVINVVFSGQSDSDRT